MSRTVKKIDSEQASHKNTNKNAGKVIKLPDRGAKIAEIAYYKAHSRLLTLGYELENWLDADNEFNC